LEEIDSTVSGFAVVTYQFPDRVVASQCTAMALSTHNLNRISDKSNGPGCCCWHCSECGTVGIPPRIAHRINFIIVALAQRLHRRIGFSRPLDCREYWIKFRG
jgi:hypothetical protein